MSPEELKHSGWVSSSRVENSLEMKCRPTQSRCAARTWRHKIFLTWPSPEKKKSVYFWVFRWKDDLLNDEQQLSLKIKKPTSTPPRFFSVLRLLSKKKSAKTTFSGELILMQFYLNTHILTLIHMSSTAVQHYRAALLASVESYP